VTYVADEAIDEGVAATYRDIDFSLQFPNYLHTKGKQHLIQTEQVSSVMGAKFGILY
jgi:hypothetical protein